MRNSVFSKILATIFYIPLSLIVIGFALAAIHVPGFSKLIFGALAGLFGFLFFRPVYLIFKGKIMPWSDNTIGAIAIDFIMLMFFMVIAPGYRNLFNYSCEGATRGSLSMIRSSISACFKENGVYPNELSQIIPEMPFVKLPKTPHKKTRDVRYSSTLEIKDTGKWLYISDPESDNFGRIVVDCSHECLKNKIWSEY